MVMTTDRIAREPLQSYLAMGATLLPAALGNHSGFSGASLWRIRTDTRELCLRAWPPAGPTIDQLSFIHRLMDWACASGLGFVPAVVRTRRNQTWVEYAGCLWDLTTWMPGRADFHADPKPARLVAACTALAQLHAVWSRVNSGSATCPAVLRRLECLRQWEALLQSHWRPHFEPGDLDPVRPWAEKAWQLLPALIARLPDLLAPWRTRVLPVQPCLCDVWHDHVLFDGDRVTGLVDYGSVKIDHVAVDLARLLGSLVGEDKEMQAAGLQAYRAVRPLSVEEESLVSVLDETGTVLGAANWLRWLYHEGRRYEDRNAVARRLAALVQRMERRRGHFFHRPL
jgi:Ser/Thr protein kinase RdoA (MazF antagonist)